MNNMVSHDSRKAHVTRNMEADMKGRLQTALQKQTITLSTWTWVFCFICIIQTGYILYMNKDVTKTIPLWFVNRWKNCCDAAEMIAGLYQWCYGYLTDYMHPYVVIGIMILASIGILIGDFFYSEMYLIRLVRSGMTAGSITKLSE